MSTTIPERQSGEEHYIGIDVGTGSARACIINSTGDIKAVTSKNIQTWQPKPEYYEQSTTDIWNCISSCVRQVISDGSIEPSTVKGIGFCATCSLAVFAYDTNEPISVNGPQFDKPDQNVILWLDHRPVEEARKINDTHDSLLKYVGGKMSVEMEIPKILWLKNNMPKELFDRCRFYDLTDVLTYLATGSETRSFCSTVCKQGYVPVGVDGSTKGWKDEFFEAIGLEDLMKDNYIRLGGVNGVNGKYISAGELVGGLNEKAASEWGLPAGVPVGSGVIDAYAGWIGTVGAKHDLSSSSSSSHATDDVSSAFGRLAAVAGTSTCHLAMSKDPIFVNGVWGPYRDVIIPHFWVAEGGQSATGELLKHIIESHPAYSEAKSLSESKSQNIYDYLDNLLHEMVKKTDAPRVSYLGRHFFLYGDLFGNRSPIADPHMKGSIIGLSSNKGVDSLALHYYGTMEFIALQTRHIIETMNQAGHRINGIYMSGSQCQNKILMNLISTVCGVRVVIPKYVTAAVCHGAAMLGAKAASAQPAEVLKGEEEGKTEDLWSIMSRMSKPGEVIMPGKDETEKMLLDVKYKVFLEQARVQQVYRREVDEAIKGWGNPTK